MTIGALSEYLKIIARDTVNKMEKKQKIIKTIICILTAILSAGCFIVMAFMPKIFETNSASAELTPPPTETENTDYIQMVGGNITSIISQNQIYAEINGNEENTGAYIYFNIKNRLPISTGETFHEINITLSYTGKSTASKNQFAIQFLNYLDEVLATHWFNEAEYNTLNLKLEDFEKAGVPIKNEIKGVQQIRIIVAPNKQSTGEETYNGTWLQLLKYDIELINKGEFGDDPFTVELHYESYLNSLVSSNEVPAYENGYDKGYAIGYDKGAAVNINPLTTFIKPVDAFLSTDIFGNISIGDVLSVILFVMVGIIFIKMFAGG